MHLNDGRDIRLLLWDSRANSSSLQKEILINYHDSTEADFDLTRPREV